VWQDATGDKSPPVPEKNEARIDINLWNRKRITKKRHMRVVGKYPNGKSQISIARK
jgi:hypothetical protein